MSESNILINCPYCRYCSYDSEKIADHVKERHRGESKLMKKSIKPFLFSIVSALQ